jgi:regulator of ribonuclease activity A
VSAADISTSDLYDQYLDKARVPAVSFYQYGGRQKFSGTAVTVKCFEDNSRVKELVATPGAGKVLVVEAGASARCALVGDVLAGEAQRNGWEGIVVYGRVRDSAALAMLDIGVMALGTTPRKSTRRGEGQVELRIQLADVPCLPGDRVFADEDGLLLLDPTLL